MTLAGPKRRDHGNDNGTDGQTDRRTDRVRRNMRPPPREEGRIIRVKKFISTVKCVDTCDNQNLTCINMKSSAARIAIRQAAPATMCSCIALTG